MKSVNVQIDKILAPASTVTAADIEALKPEIEAAHQLVHSGEGKGNDFLGWVTLPSSITDSQIAEIEAAAKTLRDEADIVIAIGIGGSYLGAKAVLEALSGSFDNLTAPKKGTNPKVLFAGQKSAKTTPGNCSKPSRTTILQRSSSPSRVPQPNPLSLSASSATRSKNATAKPKLPNGSWP